jgi:hypothetical protein
MEQIINQNPGVVVRNSLFSKNNKDSNNSFLNLIQKEQADQNKHDQLTSPVKTSSLESFNETMRYQNQEIDINNKPFASISSMSIGDPLVHNLSGSDQAEKQKKYELYEQKWFSVGKLSYIDSDKNMKSVDESITNINAARVNTKTDKDAVSNILTLERPHLFNSRLFSIQVQHDRSTQKNAVEWSKMTTQLKNVHESEKRKLSILKDNEGSMLVVRDYHSNRNDVLAYVKNLLQSAKNLISKVTFNGRGVK